MYLKVRCKNGQWFRDDGTIVGNSANPYFELYYGSKPPIIKLLDGSYIKPFYGRILPDGNKFVPLCEGVNTRLCTGHFCRGFSEDPYICPKYKASAADGFYIWVD